MKSLEKLLVVGIPRSGTTLFSALVDSLENSLCMSEPKELFIAEDAPAESRAAYVDSVVTALAEYRARVLAGDSILDRRNPDGSPTTNYVKRANRSKPKRSYFPCRNRYI